MLIRLILIFITTFITCCKQKNSIKPPKVKGDFFYFYKELFSIPYDSIEFYLPKIISKYDLFYELFTTNVINIVPPNNSKHSIYLRAFLTDFNVNKAYNAINQKFKDMSEIEKKFELTFGYIKIYLPKLKIPKIYFYHGGFNKPIIATQGIIGVGLDMYLGEDSDFYYKLGMPMYRIKKTNPEYIIIDALKYYLEGNYPYNFNADNVLSNIIHQGRIIYVLKKIMPFIEEHLIFGFTKEQLKWCKKNERNMWRFLIERKKLYSTNYMDIKRYTTDGPYTVTFPKESPARAAVWLGYQIIEKFMKKNKNITLENLLKINDYQRILLESYYNP